MSSILRALVITLLTATGVTAGEETSWETATNEKWGFSVQYPPDWQSGDATNLENAFFEDGESVEEPNALYFSIPFEKEGKTWYAGIAQVEAHRARPKTFEEFSRYYAGSSGIFHQKMTGPKKISVDGLEGYDVTMDDDQNKTKTRIAVFYAKGKGYRLTMWSGPEQGSHEKLAPVFEQFVKSFRLLK